MPNSRQALTEQSRAERHAVIREHALDGNAQAPKVVYGGSHERLGAMPAFVGMDLGECDTGVVVHGHEHVVPANVACTLCAVSRDAATDLVEAPELLDVDMQQSSPGSSRS